MTRVSESLRRIAASNRKLSWLEGTAEEAEKMERALEKYKEIGLNYEEQLSKKDEIIAALSDENKLLVKWLKAMRQAEKSNCTTDGEGDAK